MPSPIDTPMLGEFRKIAGDAVLGAFAKAKGRYSTPEEQALPLILLNSDAARFISGVCLPVDAGLPGGLATGVLALQTMFYVAIAFRPCLTPATPASSRSCLPRSDARPVGQSVF